MFDRSIVSKILTKILKGIDWMDKMMFETS